ncbi:MAG TPA: VOC family protein [Gammaproteobacteria bacterium]|nr:VOC family protein [Gammaproteobacteria bacterium]
MVEGGAVQIHGIGQVAITVRDLDRAVAFYRDVLGLKFLFQASGMAFFDLGSVRLMLGQARAPQDVSRASILYYRVDDIDAATLALEARGVKLREEPQPVHTAGGRELWLAFFEDVEGNVFALMSEKDGGAH